MLAREDRKCRPGHASALQSHQESDTTGLTLTPLFHRDHGSSQTSVWKKP